MAKARNAIGSILVLVGVGMVIVALLWWGIAIRRIVVFPGGFSLDTPCEGTVKQLAGKHGMLMLSPPLEQALHLNRSISSLDGDYRSNIAVVQEVTGSRAGAPFGLNLNRRNSYVMNRRSCENVRSGMSTSVGEVVDRSGSWYVNFPFGTKRDSVNVFDNNSGSSFAAKFVRKDEVNGVSTYLFRGSHGFRPMLDYMVRATGLPAQTTFGELKAELEAMGLPLSDILRNAAPRLTAEEKEALAAFPDSRAIALEYSTKMEWEARVEPVTGTIVDVRKSVVHIFVNTDVETFLPLLEILANHAEDPLVVRYMSQVDQQRITEPKEVYRVQYGWTSEAVRAATDYAGPRVGPMRFVTGYMMTMMLLLGAAFFVGGFVIRRKEHRASGTRKELREGPDAEQTPPGPGDGEEGADDG